MVRTDARACYCELGVELRARRLAAGLTLRQVAQSTGWSEVKICRIESGLVEIGVVDLAWYLGMIKVFAPDSVWFIDLCRRANDDRGYWLSPHGQWLPDTLGSLIYHESTAHMSTTYEPMVVPGLLQTESYARAMIGREQWRTKAEVDASVRTRMQRQLILRPCLTWMILRVFCSR